MSIVRNTESDLEFENKIRPQELETFSGQDKIVDNLHIFIKAALMRGDSLDHVLLHGPPGLGKTTLANIIANEMGAQLRVTSGPVLAKPGDLAAFQSTLGRTAIRQIETIYIANLMVEWVNELAEAIKGGDSEYFREPARLTGEGTGFWEAPRGALYHSEKVVDGKIEGYQIIIPSTWNLAPINLSLIHI